LKNEHNEEIKRIENSIRIFSDLIDKGTEIHGSLMASEEVENLFPNFKKLGEIVSRAKMLTDSNE